MTWTEQELREWDADVKGASGSANGSTPDPSTDEMAWLVGVPMDPDATVAEPLPALPGFPFLHEGAAAVIVGPTGGGRSSLIEACLYDAALGGLQVAYLGCEVTEPEFNARAALLAERRGDAVDDELRERLSRVRYVNLASAVTQAWADPQAWVEGVVERYQLLAIDPLSAVASALDLDFDQRNAEFVKFYDKLVAPLTARGVAVPMVDNTGHALEARMRAKGVSAKQDRADLTFSCTLLANPPGLIVKTHKVRSVRAGFQRGDEWLFLRESQRIERRDGDSEITETAFRPTTIMRRVSEAVEADEGLTRNAIRATVKGRSEYVDLALQLLVAEDFIGVRRDGQAKHHVSLKPYRSDADCSTGTTGTKPGPNRDQDPVADTGTNRDHHRYVVPGGPGPGSGGAGPSNQDQPPGPHAAGEEMRV